LGKEPIAAIERLYREGKLSLEQVLSINDRKYPDLAKLKEEIKKSLMKQETLIKQIDILKAKLEQPASKSVTTRRKNLLNVKLAMLKAIQAGKRPGDWPEYTGGHQEG
jgi:S-adenosylmethionine:diacylglycerol 3-amino-3-carboxypropyl transferase